MCNVCVEVQKLREEAKIPAYAHDGDSGFDFFLLDDAIIPAGKTAVLPTGLAFAIPRGFELQIRLRSGAAVNTPLLIKNSPGTIDSGYRGEVGIIVYNAGSDACFLKKGERIAQGIVAPVAHAMFVPMQALEESERGSGGFGSTGK